MVSTWKKGGLLTRGRLWVAISFAFVIALTSVLPVGAYTRPGVTERVSVTSSGGQAREGFQPIASGNCGTRSIDISEDARYVAFAFDASDLVAGDLNAACDIFVRDRKTGTTERVSLADSGAEAIGACPTGLTETTYSRAPSISASGRFVAFASCATNLVPGDTNLSSDIFVRDLKRATTIRVSLASDGKEATAEGPSPGRGEDPSISDDGNLVAFRSDASNLVTPPPKLQGQVYVRDVKSGTTELVSRSASGESANHNFNFFPAISGDGKFVAYCSSATNIVEPDANGGGFAYDVFVYDRMRETPELVTVATDGTQQRTYQLLLNYCGIENASDDVISDDGRFITFASYASNLVPSDTNGEAWAVGQATDYFVRDRKLGRTERVSVTSVGEQGPNQGGWWSSLSANGRFVLFGSQSPLDASTPRIGLFVHDRHSGATTIVSRSLEKESCEAEPGAFSFDGRYAAFVSRCDSLVEDDTNDAQDAFVRDIGPDLGTGSDPIHYENEEPDDHLICITPDICIPPSETLWSPDSIGDTNTAMTKLGANLYGASLAHRTQFEDLFATIELKYMPPVIAGPDHLFYGLRFGVEGRSYEARATSFAGGTFGLFDCTGNASICTEVGKLQGGFGTTGARVVLSLPLDQIGLQDGGTLANVEAFTALGSYTTGVSRTLDSVTLK